MSAPHADQIIAGYLARLKDALSALPTRRRDEIMAEIEDHITEARAGLAGETDADLLGILARLGHPADIAEEARARFGLPDRGPGPLEIAALLLIGLSGVVFPIPPAGWVTGVVLVWLSPCWTLHEKRRGAYLPLVIGLAVSLLAVLTGPLTRSGNFPLILAATTLLPLVSAVYLALHLGRRLRPIAWMGLALVAAIVMLAPGDDAAPDANIRIRRLSRADRMARAQTGLDAVRRVLRHNRVWLWHRWSGLNISRRLF